MATVKLLSGFRHVLVKEVHFFKTAKYFYCSASFITSDNIVLPQYPKIEIPNLTLHEFLTRNAQKWGNKTATECAVTGRGYTYNQLIESSNKLAQAIRAQLGFKKGDVIAFMLPNVPEYAPLFIGCFQAGLIITTINPVYTIDEATKQMASAKAKGIVTLVEKYDLASESTRKMNLKTPPVIITIKDKTTDRTPDNAIDFGELCSYDGKQTKLEKVSPEDISLLPYSSGTSGLPKAVLLKHINVVADLAMLRVKPVNIVQETTKDHQDIVPIIAPIFHCYGMIPILFNMISQGAKCVTLPKYSPERFYNMLVRYPVTVMHLVPPIVVTLLNDTRAKKAHLSHVRYVLSAAAPLAASDAMMFHEKFGSHIPLLQAYGLSETGPVTHFQRIDQDIVLGSVGQNLPNTECRVVSVDDESKNLGPNKAGHLLIRGPQVMPSYYNNPEATKEAFQDDWFRTGDIAHYDEKGNFFITDRIKELIKVKGYQVAPAEIEGILREHPDIEDAAVTGVRHPQHGEAPKAYVVLRKGSNLKPQQVQEFVQGKVAKYKQLTGGVEFVESIPKTSSGKILRRLLKELAN